MAHKTVVGILPDTWTGALLKNISKVVRGSSPRPAGSPLYFDGDYLPWVTVADITNSDGMYLNSTKSMLTALGSEYTRITEPGTLMLTNSGATLGVPKISMIRSGANDGIAMLLNLNGIEKEFAYYYLASKTTYFREVLAPGVGQPNLNTELIGDFPIPVPPLPEQKKIAQILSTWDKAITTTEQLLANSLRQKKALMQQLLTGKKRLLDNNGVRFSGEWNRLSFSKLVSLGKTKLDPKTSNEVKECIELEHISQETATLLGSTNTKESVSTKTAFGMNSILFGKLRPYLRKYWLSDRDGVCSTEIWVFNTNPKHSIPEYIFQIVQMDFFIDATNKSSGTHMPRADWNLVRDIFVHVPCLEEQQKIAAVLTAADQEITTLQHKLDALKQEKKALMQQLLTGKRRVKIEQLEKAAC